MGSTVSVPRAESGPIRGMVFVVAMLGSCPRAADRTTLTEVVSADQRAAATFIVNFRRWHQRRIAHDVLEQRQLPAGIEGHSQIDETIAIQICGKNGCWRFTHGYRLGKEPRRGGGAVLKEET